MNSRERILSTLNHQEPDRCATFSWMGEWAWKTLEDELQMSRADAAERLGIDHWHGFGLPVATPDDHDTRLQQFIPETLCNAADVKIHKDGRVERNGVKIWWPLQNAESVDDMADYPFETPDLIATPTAEHRAEVRRLKDAGWVVTGATIQPFKAAWELRGMENLMCDFMLQPDFVDFLYDRIYGFVAAYCVRLAAAGVDVVQIYGDLAMQDRLLVPPELWRRFDKARLTALIEQVKRTNPAVKVFMHTDGDVSAIVPDLIDCGLDILNPIQPECMDPVEVKRRWGDRLVLHGGVSLQRTLPFGTVDDVKGEVRRLVSECGRGGGYVLGPTNAITGDVPIRNIIAMYEAVNDE